MVFSSELERNDRLGLIALPVLAACCIVPMLAILGLTTIVGVSLGRSAALIVGAVAGALCVTVMATHHRLAGEAQHGESEHG